MQSLGRHTLAWIRNPKAILKSAYKQPFITSSAWSAQQHIRCSAHMPRRELRVLEDVTLTPEHQPGRRLDILLSELFPQRFGSPTGVKRAIRRKEIRHNGSVPRTDSIVQLGDNLQVVVKLGSAPVAPNASEGKQGLDIVYEDDHFACVIKPQGIPTQGKGEGSVQGRVKYCLQPTHLPGALFRPHQVHRLDAGTGGLVLIAKTRAAVAALGTDLAAHNMQKRYLALVIGRLEGDGIVNYPLQGKTAISLFSAVQHCPSETFGWLTWVSLWPKTGRTHQLRKHMAYIGHPILGDLQYRHHRRPDCQAVQVTDAQQYVPQLQDLVREVLPEQQAQMAAAAQAAAVQDALLQLKLQGQAGQVHQQELLTLQLQQGAVAAEGLTVDKQWLHRMQSSKGSPSVCIDIHAVAAGNAGSRSTADGSSPLSSRVANQHASRLEAGNFPDDPGPCVNVADCSMPSSNTVGLEASSADSSTSVDAADAIRLLGDDDDDDDSSPESTTGDAAEEESMSSSSQEKKVQLLRDGSTVDMCLWAVQLQLLHPISREPLGLSIDSPVQIFRRICEVEAPVGT